MSNIYNFDCKNHLGENVSLSDYQGQVLLIVNTASKCGFTPQYEGLNELHEKYHSKDFSVLGFPCNQFGGQEPGSNEEIQNFCSLNFQTTFPVFGKIDVNGERADPLYQYLTEAQPGILGTKKIKWNFTKFLINKNGEVVKRFASSTKPKDISNSIEALIS
jgi:glutathione peroxidase|tara:strand:+ start:49 stop:531 length:483 start_codon:yes stop_codon:yes gene_type:complete